MFKLGPKVAAAAVGRRTPRSRAPRSQIAARTQVEQHGAHLVAQAVAGIARRAAHVEETQVLLLPDRRESGCPTGIGRPEPAPQTSIRTPASIQTDRMTDLQPFSTALNGGEVSRRRYNGGMRNRRSLQSAPMDRRESRSAQAAGRQQAAVPGQRFHRHGGGRTEFAQGLSP